VYIHKYNCIFVIYAIGMMESTGQLESFLNVLYKLSNQLDFFFYISQITNYLLNATRFWV